ncbi:hypothetical protein F2Q68_00006817 [Brassica cretica]|uniref:Thioredoxin domain-containing protein n=1 Tax=Brassica cretica TaxID=69181 RepID=A0A8S9JIQ7_BRACR|nr:hypothetical protein F2Q68_00006817 [Brassica cretica]
MEKKNLYGSVVMLMYGVVKRIRDKAEWDAILADADHYIGLTVTSPLCGGPCAILYDQVAQIVDSFGVRIQFTVVNIWQLDILSPWIPFVFTPTVIIFKHGNVITRYENLLDWGNFYNLLVGSSTFSFAFAPAPPTPTLLCLLNPPSKL